ncbi:septum formation inhibitor [Lasius niger]|uniref:Septum formation inhibitor n=1 Tax=Lasius niger TaxID=67767 RepID=A0A0J7KNP7_LASNI|nr:septum formation inhibitor [Lasius niger]
MPENPIDLWLSALEHEIETAPHLFRGRAVILDLSEVKENTPELTALPKRLRDMGLFITGVEGQAAYWPSLKEWNIPIAPSNGGQLIPLESELSETAEVQPKKTALIIEETIRSGQLFQHAEGDVIIMGNVSWGAEIIAGGSIIVYGALRGRAIAGLEGASDARVIAQQFEAELIAIDGYYSVLENFPANLIGQPAQAKLINKRVELLGIPSTKSTASSKSSKK